MDEQLIQKRSEAIEKVSARRTVTPQDAALAKMVVKVRQVQGWNLQTAGDAKLMASAWKEQLDRKGVDHRLYDELINMAIDHRTRQIGKGRAPTPLTVELMLACFEAYKTDVYNKRRQTQQIYNNIRSVVERVKAGVLHSEIAMAHLLSTGTESDEEITDFDELATRISERYEQKLEGFLEEYYL